MTGKHRFALRAGFTLVEMITVIILLGVLAGVTSQFILPAIEGYRASERRARLTDIADTAARRIARDLQSALPNNVRVENNQLDLIPVLAGGRYSQNGADSAGCFAAGCSTLTSLGSVVSANGQYVGNRLVIYNLSNNVTGNCHPNLVTGLPSVWCGHNSSVISGSTDGGSTDTLTFASQFFRPSVGSPTRTFFIIGAPIAYECVGVGVSGGNGTGALYRYSGCRLLNKAGDLYGSLCSSSSKRLVADRLSDCVLTYQPINERMALVLIELAVREADEEVRLYHEVHVDNAP